MERGETKYHSNSGKKKSSTRGVINLCSPAKSETCDEKLRSVVMRRDYRCPTNSKNCSFLLQSL